MNTISKINHDEREVLVQQREGFLEKLKDLQFKLFDKNSAEVVEYVNQLQLEKTKQQSLIKQAQSKLEHLEPELESFEEGAEHILLEAISQQEWYGFRNKREIVFDCRTGILFPNFEFMPHCKLHDWKQLKKNYAPNNIEYGKWSQLYELDCHDYGFSNKEIKNDFDYPKRFRGIEKINLCGYYSGFDNYYKDRNYHLYYIQNFSKDNISSHVSRSDNEVANAKILLALKVLNNDQLRKDNPRLTVLEKAKIILDFFIEQDWIPSFEPFLEKFHNEDDEDFQERLNEVQQQSDEYNRLFDAYYQRIQLQKQLVSLEAQIAELPEPASVNVFTSDFDYHLELDTFNLDAIKNSVWQYSEASQQWLNTLLNRVDEWENQHLNLVKNTVELNQELDKKLPVGINVSTEEKQLLESQLQHLKQRLDIGLMPLRSNLINLLLESQQISAHLEQTNTFAGLAQIEQQLRPSFTLLAEHSATLCTKTLKEMEWLDQSLDFVKIVVSVLRKSSEDYLIFVDKYQQDLMQIGLDNSIEAEEITKWFAEWRTERLSLLKQIQPLLDAGLNKIIDEQTVLDVLPCIEQYQTELDQFYLQKRLGIHTTYAFQPNGHRQEKLEKEQELTKLVHQFMQQLEKVIFNTKTTAQKIWLIRFSEVWQQGIVNEITDFISKEQLIERDDIVQIMSEELRKVQQQNLVACLQDAQSYSEALAQREKDMNTLIFKMRKALMK